jgi:hypothetical protein
MKRKNWFYGVFMKGAEDREKILSPNWADFFHFEHKSQQGDIIETIINLQGEEAGH